MDTQANEYDEGEIDRIRILPSGKTSVRVFPEGHSPIKLVEEGSIVWAQDDNPEYGVLTISLSDGQVVMRVIEIDYDLFGAVQQIAVVDTKGAA